MRFGFTTFAVALIIESPSYFAARAYARARLGTDALFELLPKELPKKIARDVRLRWRGTDYTGVMRLQVNERVACAWTGWQ